MVEKLLFIMEREQKRKYIYANFLYRNPQIEIPEDVLVELSVTSGLSYLGPVYVDIETFRRFDQLRRGIYAIGDEGRPVPMEVKIVNPDKISRL